VLTHASLARTQMLADVVRVAIEAVISCKDEKAAAVKLKKHLDDKYAKSTWHCVLGKHFAISFSHATKFCAFFTVREFNVLVFKGDD
jgi:dynein light chain LC8-type